MARRRRQGIRSRSSGSGGSDTHAARGTAPGSADLSELEPIEPSEEAKVHQPSTVDAMGQDKRRQVVGHSYGPSRRSQIMFFVAVAAVIFLVIGGSLALVSAFDQAPDEYPDRAPWTETATTPELVAQQKATPRSPSTPCGEPGNEYPAPSDSPCRSLSTEPKPSASSGGR
ncbi:MAG TPA: hypothetical protein VFT14_05925 [Solirubrobacterales bacterium]|nr:hypothetical protein [Solirubrobacterales bacterium]